MRTQTKERTMNAQRCLSDAIDRSRLLSEIANATFAGDQAAMLAELRAMYDGNIDSVKIDDSRVDVWGWTDDMPEGTMDWRLTVTIGKTSRPGRRRRG